MPAARAPNRVLPIFVATRSDQIPPECTRVLSVDGSVPGFAVRWDHHTTGERINLDAMPDLVELDDFDGIATTSADMDAVASVVAALLGGKAALPAEARAVLESASCWCDHLAPHPAHDAEINRLGRGLLDATNARLQGAPASASQRFSDACRELAARVARGEPLPFDDRWDQERAKAASIARAGRLRRLGDVALVDLRGVGSVDPLALYELHDAPLAVAIEDHRGGGVAYTVGTNPRVASRPTDLGPALRALAAAEHAHGPPSKGPEPAPGNENWGGRATVFGSPWDYGSRLGAEEVVRIVARAMAGDGR
jgi:hypothetical protein